MIATRSTSIRGTSIRRVPMRGTVRVAAAVLVTLVASCAAAALGAPASAHAAAVTTAIAATATATTSTAASTTPTRIVQFSDDGIHWSDSYSGRLYQDVLLVPGGETMRSFYVRNGASEAAILRVTLTDVTTDSIPLANAVSISTSTTGAPGAAVPVTRARPCFTLSQGLRLAAGDSIRLDNTVSLAELDGTDGQTGSVSFGLRVSFSSTDSAAPTPDTCPVDGGTVGAFPNLGDGSGSGAAVYRHTASGWTPVSPGGSTVTTPTTSNAPAGSNAPATPDEPDTPFVQTLVSNTERFYQEYDVAFWLAMSVLGALIVVLVRRRRANEPEDPEHHRQIGTGR